MEVNFDIQVDKLPQTVSEEFEQIKQNKNVIDWWHKKLRDIHIGYQGFSHGLNRNWAEIANTQTKVKEVVEFVNSVERENKRLSESLGKTQTDLLNMQIAHADLLKRFETMAAWVKKNLETKTT